jgi:plasmid stabilization system protein ParE
MKLEWSDQALADLNRFAEFLHREHPTLAPVVAPEIIGAPFTVNCAEKPYASV